MKSSLTEAEIENVLREHTRWQWDQGKLVREWTFPDFVAAMAFVNRVAEMAESAGHHPDIDIRYNQVRLGLVSHDASGITRRDVAMVAQLDTRF